MNSVLELLILRGLEIISNFKFLAQYSRHSRVLASAVMFLAENGNLIAWSSAYPCSDMLGGAIYRGTEKSSCILSE